LNRRLFLRAKGVIFDRKGENGEILYSVADRLGDVSRASSGNLITVYFLRILVIDTALLPSFVEMFDTEAGSLSSNDQQQMQEMKVRIYLEIRNNAKSLDAYI
jgi:hypothetical protein